jgi:hypothetical protein
MPRETKLASALLDGSDDLVRDVLMDVKTLFHGSALFASGRVIAASWGGQGRKKGAVDSNAARERAAWRGGAAQAQRGSEPR